MDFSYLAEVVDVPITLGSNNGQSHFRNQINPYALTNQIHKRLVIATIMHACMVLLEFNIII